MKIETTIANIIAKEGGYVDHADDRGGATCWGITEAVARAAGWHGAMQDLPVEFAEELYLRKYWKEPRFDAVAVFDGPIADELADTGVNMGPAAAVKMLQRCLNVFNHGGKFYGDVAVDGAIGAGTLTALKEFCIRRGAEGRLVLLKALNCLQGARYIELAEARAQNESFVYGWLKERVGL